MLNPLTTQIPDCVEIGLAGIALRYGPYLKVAVGVAFRLQFSSEHIVICWEKVPASAVALGSPLGYPGDTSRCCALKIVICVRRYRRQSRSVASRDSCVAFENCGITMEEMIPRITTTMSISMSVKPRPHALRKLVVFAA